MKLASLLILTTVIVSHLFSQNGADKLDFRGKVMGADCGYVYIGYFKNLNERVIDSCLLKNGHFQFVCYIDGTRKLDFYKKNKFKNIDDSNSTEIFVEPGNITASFKEGKFRKAEIKGSRSQNEYCIYLSRLESLEGKWKNVFNEWDQAIIKRDTSTLDSRPSKSHFVFLDKRMPFTAFVNTSNSCQ